MKNMHCICPVLLKETLNKNKSYSCYLCCKFLLDIGHEKALKRKRNERETHKGNSFSACYCQPRWGQGQFTVTVKSHPN